MFAFCVEANLKLPDFQMEFGMTLFGRELSTLQLWLTSSTLRGHVSFLLADS